MHMFDLLPYEHRQYNASTSCVNQMAALRVLSSQFSHLEEDRLTFKCM